MSTKFEMRLTCVAYDPQETQPPDPGWYHEGGETLRYDIPWATGPFKSHELQQHLQRWRCQLLDNIRTKESQSSFLGSQPL